MRSRIYGIDFSGAKKAGKKIWIAEGIVEDNRLRIKECFRAADLPNSSSDRDDSLISLRNFIRDKGPAILGFDFPFGLPGVFVGKAKWENWVVSFEKRFGPDPDDFRRFCLRISDGKELKRVTDQEAGTPFSSYNLRLYRQTYFGIRDILSPLVKRQEVSVLPMQEPLPKKPWLVEVCPASTLKKLGMRISYKGKGAKYRLGRKTILSTIKTQGQVDVPAKIRSRAIGDAEGDALDGIIATFSAFHSIKDSNRIVVTKTHMKEGYVFF